MEKGGDIFRTGDFEDLSRKIVYFDKNRIISKKKINFLHIRD